jgi:aminoglycoside phosphotransferase (APT) family kinase protein
MAVMTESDVVAYLLDAGLIDTAAVVDGDLRVLDASRRNANFRVMREAGPSYLIKIGAGRDPFVSTEREARVYRLLSEAAGVTMLLPRVYAFDPERELLVLELFAGVDDLRNYHRQRGRFPVSIAAQVGRALARLHALALADRARELRVPEPAGFFLDRPGVGILHHFSSAAADLVRLIQRSDEVGERLEVLRSEWRLDAFIHHDARWDNVLITRSSHGAPVMKLIDWEAAGVGDPAWDLGSFLGDYVAFWINSIPLTGHVRADSYLDLARYPLAAMQPAVRACWNAYLATAELTGADAGALLHRAAAYAGIKLMETSLEHVQQAPECTMTAVTLLQVGANMVTHPQEAAAVLLGITAGARP